MRRVKTCRTPAVARLRIAQLPLIQQIRALEEELGTQLFERTQSGMRPLPSAKRLLLEARAIVERVRALPALCREARGGLGEMSMCLLRESGAAGPASESSEQQRHPIFVSYRAKRRPARTSS